MDMSDKSPSAMYFQNEDDTPEAEENDNEEIPLCTKLQLDEHLQAYIKKNSLVRDNIVKSIACNHNIVDKVILNYIIVKQILSNLDWQDKMLCSHVCTTWHSAVQSLNKENASPQDFVIEYPRSLPNKTHFRKSGNFNTEPLVVMIFAKMTKSTMKLQCKNIEPKTCQDTCESEHCLLDVIYKYTSAPKKCMIAIRTDYLSYMPLPQSITSKHTITHLKSVPFICGLYIPHIPDVQCHRINVKSYNDMSTDFFDAVDELSTTRIFKGVIVFVTDKYLLHTVEDIIFLNHFKKVQPDIPYALGGCIIDDTIFERDLQGVVAAINENKDYISENLITIAAFTVPKSSKNNENNFDMFSIVLDSSEWSKAKIESSITEFSKQVPRYEHSTAIKLSCVGRDKKHKFEQDCFRAAFPDTRIVGCYGNGELGIDHPMKNEGTTIAKRIKRDPGPPFRIMYSYSSAFVYMGWGKITSPMGPVTK